MEVVHAWLWEMLQPLLWFKATRTLLLKIGRHRAPGKQQMLILLMSLAWILGTRKLPWKKRWSSVRLHLIDYDKHMVSKRSQKLVSTSQAKRPIRKKILLPVVQPAFPKELLAHQKDSERPSNYCSNSTKIYSPDQTQNLLANTTSQSGAKRSQEN